MGISIKHDEVEAMIRRLASHRGASLTEAIGTAVRHELEREGIAAAPMSYDERVRQAQAIVARAAILDPRTPDEILGYDEHGLPS